MEERLESSSSSGEGRAMVLASSYRPSSNSWDARSLLVNSSVCSLFACTVCAKNITPCSRRILKFVILKLTIFSDISHTYFAFKCTPNYKVSFSYL